MEEEGDAVYFESSPELDVMKAADIDVADSLYRDIGDGLDDNVRDTLLDTAITEDEGVEYGSRDTGKGLRQLMSHDRQQNDGIKMAELVLSSSLLTEEDRQYLIHSMDIIATARQTGLTSYNKPVYPVTPPILLTPLNISVLVSVVGAILLAGSLINMGVALLIMGGALFIPYLVFSRQSSGSCDSHMTEYLRACEKFLSVLTKSIQYIQEMELVYNGFDRPSVGVPMSRLESNIIRYQCMFLRGKVYSLCDKGVWLTRDHVQSLVNKFPLPPEVDSTHEYFAFRDLSELHDHLGNHGSPDGGGAPETDDKPAQLSLHSLKMAASVFAVTNSELLKLSALLVSTRGFMSNKHALQALTNDTLNKLLQSLTQFVSDASLQLEWAMQYHSKPSSDTTPPSSADSTQCDPHTSRVELELHSCDLQLLTALNKIREVSKDKAEDLEGEVRVVLNHLNSAERHLKQLLAHLPPTDLNTKDNSDDNEQDLSQEEEEGVPLSLGATNDISSSSDEEDEKVYEAIVTGIEESRDSHVIEESEYSTEQRAASLSVLHELNSVLAVRKVERQKKSTAKKKKKRKLTNSDDSNQPLLEHKEEMTEPLVNVTMATDNSNGSHRTVVLKEVDTINSIEQNNESIEQHRETDSHTSGLELGETDSCTSGLELGRTDSHTSGLELGETDSHISELELGETVSHTGGLELGPLQYTRTTAAISNRLSDDKLASSVRSSAGINGPFNMLALAVASRAKIKHEEVFFIDDDDDIDSIT